jgi:poly(3-hydroxybutyrate) depolymerase
MSRIAVSIILALSILLSLCALATARNFTGETGNKATFETLEEAHQNSPAVVKTYQASGMPGPGAMGPGAAGPAAPGRGGAGAAAPGGAAGPGRGAAAAPGAQGPAGAGRGGAARTYAGHPALDKYPKGTTFVYRSANMYGGRAAARMNTNLIVYVEQHFDTKDAALAWLKSAGLIRIADEATGSIVLVTPIGRTFGTADVAPYYALQTAMLAQGASGTAADGSPATFTDAEYFGGFAYEYFIGVDGGATFFNNNIAGTFDFASRIAGALLIGGGVDEVRKVSSFIPVYMVNAGDTAIEKYKAANHVNAVKTRGDLVIHYNQALPLQQVILAKANPVNLAALVDAAYHDMFIKAMRVPVALSGVYSVGTPYTGYTMDQAPYSLCERNALINGVTGNGIHMVKHQGEDRFASIKTQAGEYLDTWYEYLPDEVLKSTAPKGTVPLILGNHGGGDEVRQFVDEMGLLALAGNERIAVVAADHQSLPNDVRGPALTALVKYMLAKYPALDPSRVYAIGYSMGGGATFTVGYYEPKLFAAIAPIAGTNVEPAAAEVAKFANTQLPIYLSTSSYDVRRLQAAESRINDNLAGQVKRWSGWNGVPAFNFDFNAYKLSGYKGDASTVETLNGEYASHTWYLNNSKGYPMVALNYVKDLIHALYPEYARIAWDYMKHFSRDPQSGAIKYDPYIK